MDKKIARIGVLTSGGDAPGMNSAIRAVARTAAVHNIQCLGIRRGYNGLINGDVTELGPQNVAGIVTRGGTILYTARCPEFMTEAGMQKAVDSCRYLGLDGLVVIGGDGTFRGALALAAHGVPTIGIPGTIDNDIGCTHYSIGFDTACNTAISCIDKLRDTMQSHERCSVVEVMGRNAGHLAVYVGIAVGAAAILVPEKEVAFETDVIEKMRSARIHGRNHSIIIVAEGVGRATDIGGRIKTETGMDPRVTILGHIQRGGAPTARDRVTASRMGVYAVETLLEGRFNRVVCIRNGEMCDHDIDEALAMKRDLQESMYRTALTLTSV
ncbi:MAG: 6-phosphofructokinase [Oscillospiraceae bacterium]|nr:6-phosphofructokinase [Oscillospiraceae bacterium]